MTKKQVADVYRFLSDASMSRLSDSEKIRMIRTLRVIKPVFVELREAVTDAVEKAKAEGMAERDILPFMEKACEDVFNEESGVVPDKMSADAFDRLCLSNNWTFSQIDELSSFIVS